MTAELLGDPVQDGQPLLVKQPIFESDKSIWGYELVSHESLTATDGDTVSLDSMVAGFLESMAAYGMGNNADKKLFFNIDNSECFGNFCLNQCMKNCVFSVCGSAVRSSECCCFAEGLREKGGCVAVDADGEPEAVERMLDKCDIIKVSLAGKSPGEIVEFRRKYKEFSGKLLAADIPDWEAFEGTKALGFKYFHGPFFSTPQLPEDAKLRAGSVPKLQLLRELSAPSCEMDELASIIASDVSLSYRILRYINSPAFGMRNEIKSIQQAVSLLGLKELKHWATVVVMTGLDSTPKGEELAYMALQRARFLSKLAEAIEQFHHSPATMFMLGLFSKLDALLSYPMEKALESIPMEENLKEGLCGGQNEYGSFLRLLAAVEGADWETANEIFGRYGVSVSRASIEYMRASRWAAEQLPSMKAH